MTLKTVSELVEMYSIIIETDPGLVLENIENKIAITTGPLEMISALNRKRAEVQTILDEATLIQYLEDNEIEEDEWQYYSCRDSVIYFNGEIE